MPYSRSVASGNRFVPKAAAPPEYLKWHGAGVTIEGATPYPLHQAAFSSLTLIVAKSAQADLAWRGNGVATGACGYGDLNGSPNVPSPVGEGRGEGLYTIPAPGQVKRPATASARPRRLRLGRCGAALRARGEREKRRGRGRRKLAVLLKESAALVMRIALVEVEHRLAQASASLEKSGPLVAGLGGEEGLKLAMKRRPLRAIVLPGRELCRVEAEARGKGCEKLRLRARPRQRNSHRGSDRSGRKARRHRERSARAARSTCPRRAGRG